MTIPARLVGRAELLRRLGGLLVAARNGDGSALLLTGEAGVGKTSLLESLIEGSSSERFVHLDGYAAETALPYAGLERLLGSIGESLSLLPEHLAKSLRVATGYVAGSAPDRFQVGLATLRLIAEAGGREPLIVTVDDVQLLDAETRSVLAFVGRRLKAEPASLLFAARDDEEVVMAFRGVPHLPVEGLDVASSVRLLRRHSLSDLDPAIAVTVAKELRGNPLALVDLSYAFDATLITEVALAKAPIPIGDRLEPLYLARAGELPVESRLYLLIAAAESTGDSRLVDAAEEMLGAAEGRSAAEASGLITTQGSIRFRHPLVRSAIYNGATSVDRTRVHAALAKIAREGGEWELATIHASAATVGAAPEVVGALRELADVSGARGALLSRAGLLLRAADLTDDLHERDELLVDAAEAALGGGAAQLASDLVAGLEPKSLPAVTQGRILAIRAQLSLFTADRDGIVRVASSFVEAADHFHGHDPEREQQALIRAFEYSLTAEWMLEGITLPELGRRLAEGAAVRPGRPSVILRGLSAHVLLPYGESVPLMRAAAEVVENAGDDELLGYGFFAVPLLLGLFDDARGAALLERTITVARDTGAVQSLDAALWLRGTFELARGRPIEAGRAIEQVRELRRALGYEAEQVVNAAALAWAGAPIAQVDAINDATLATGFGGVWSLGSHGIAVRLLADGEYGSAYERISVSMARRFLQASYMQLADFVEASARSGHENEAVEVVDELDVFARETGTPWARGLAARSRAVVTGDGAESHFTAAIEQLRESTATGDLGRAHLLYGEWLRRRRRRRDAREQLRSALSVFDAVQAPAFASRARRELAALGDIAMATVTNGTDLTAQESLVARMAAEGLNNGEIAANLFISPNTVDYHLRKVFRKLGVTTRRQIRDSLRVGP